MHHATEIPSPWVVRWAPEVRKGPVLDLACGGGRHSRFFRDLGFEVFAVDVQQPDLPEEVHFVRANLEDGSPWPFEGRRFGAIIVTNSLHRPLLPKLAESLDEGGVLIYDTFMAGNERFAKLMADSGPAAWEDDNFDVRFAFFGRTDREIRLRILEGRRARLEERLSRVREQVDEVRGSDAYAAELRRHGIESVEREVRWLTDLIAAERGAGPTDA